MAHLQTIGPQTLNQWIIHNDVLIIDVREPAEYNAGHIPEAHNIPLSSLSKKLDAIPLSQNKKVVLYCQRGNRSATGCKTLIKKAFKADIWHLEGGLKAWETQGYKIVRTGKQIFPIDQQVQITVGAFVLLGIGLGYFVTPLWLLLPAFIAAGLLNAGITGWCGLAKVLAKMPWNQSS